MSDKTDPCGVCGEGPFKYKCSKCYTFKYCSLACYKTHKEACVGTVETKTNETSSTESLNTTVQKRPLETSSLPEEKSSSPNEEPLKRTKTLNVENQKEQPHIEHTLSREALTSLAQNNEIRLALQNKELQSLIQLIDTAPAPSTNYFKRRRQKTRDDLLEQLMTDNQHFADFVDDVLRIVSPEELAVPRGQ